MTTNLKEILKRHKKDVKIVRKLKYRKYIIPLLVSNALDLEIGIITVNFTMNNIFVSLYSSAQNKVIATISLGTIDCLGKKRKTSYALRQLSFFIKEKVQKADIDFVKIYFQGIIPKSRRLFTFMKPLMYRNHIFIHSIEFRKSLPHNGCKLPKKVRK